MTVFGDLNASLKTTYQQKAAGTSFARRLVVLDKLWT
jgi:hypothetical protein